MRRETHFEIMPLIVSRYVPSYLETMLRHLGPALDLKLSLGPEGVTFHDSQRVGYSLSIQKQLKSQHLLERMSDLDK